MIKPKELLERKRPMLTDPKEWAIIRGIHFEGRTAKDAPSDQIERLDRMDRKSKQKNHAR